jgi:N-acetylmuramoyl-L-alanine amidase
VRRRLALLGCLGALAGCGGSHHGSPTEVQLPTAGGHARTRPAPVPARPLRRAPRPSVTAPTIVQRPIPFGQRRRRETAAYAQRHYGISSYRLSNPHVIVMHYTGTETFAAAYAMFAPDSPDPELHELPGICSQFVVVRDGTVYQLVPLSYMCRHTVGLNYTAIGIEQVGTTDDEILHDRRQLKASLALARWLRCRFGIPVGDVIGHNESLSSPYHRERVARLRSQTHPDWTRADMGVYRAKLRALGGC